MKPKQTEKKETDVLDTLYMDFLCKYEGALSSMSQYIQAIDKVPASESGQMERLECLRRCEGRADGYRDCLNRIKMLKDMKESGDL